MFGSFVYANLDSDESMEVFYSKNPSVIGMSDWTRNNLKNYPRFEQYAKNLLISNVPNLGNDVIVGVVWH